MMVLVWLEPPVHQELRVRAPVAPAPDRLREAYFAEVGRLTFGVVRGERWRLRVGPLTVLAFAEPAFADGAWTWPITGGLLARRPGGTLRIGSRDGELTLTVDGYLPALPALAYRLTQVQAHRAVSRRVLLALRGRRPAPAPPAGPAQRLLTASLDLALCAGIAAAVSRRRPRGPHEIAGLHPPGSAGGTRGCGFRGVGRLTTFAGLAAGYHLACWTLGGRTLAGRLTGQRLVSVDGSAVAPWQALLRLAALPRALRTLRAVHDEVAATEVIEA